MRSSKASAWIQGRKDLFEHLFRELGENTQPIIWVHNASTGEFEQAKPLIEALRQRYPNHKVLATFFSPSGFDAAAAYTPVDYRYYLPIDTAANARRFVAMVQPTLVIFSKYDFWHHHIKAVHDAGVPLLLIAAVFRPGQAFFRWYGGFHRAMLRRFTHLFVQDAASVALLHGIGISHCSISGDTRFDRVCSITADKSGTETKAAAFVGFVRNRPCLVAGSTWAGDEALLTEIATTIPELCLLIVPHEIDGGHIAQLQKLFPNAFLYSDLERAFPVAPLPGTSLWTSVETAESKLLEAKFLQANVMIVDAMGKLSALYSLATITYVGGGFTRDGIHNTLEAAVWGKPVLFGPNYKKYREAKELIAAGGAFSFSGAGPLQQQLLHLLHNEAARRAASHAAASYVRENAGATNRIMAVIVAQLKEEQ